MERKSIPCYHPVFSQVFLTFPWYPFMLLGREERQYYTMNPERARTQTVRSGTTNLLTLNSPRTFPTIWPASIIWCWSLYMSGKLTCNQTVTKLLNIIKSEETNLRKDLDPLLGMFVHQYAKWTLSRVYWTTIESNKPVFDGSPDFAKLLEWNGPVK